MENGTVLPCIWTAESLWDTGYFSFLYFFFFWLLPKTHSAFLLKASYLDNAVLVRHSNVAFHLSVKHLVVGQYWMSWIIALSHCVNSHILRVVINTLKKSDAQLYEDRNKLAGTSGFTLVPSAISSGFCCKSRSHLRICFYTCLAKFFYFIFKCFVCHWITVALAMRFVWFFRCLLSPPAIQGKSHLLVSTNIKGKLRKEIIFLKNIEHSKSVEQMHNCGWAVWTYF